MIADGVDDVRNLFILPHLWYVRDPSFGLRETPTSVRERLLFSASAVAKIKYISFAICSRTGSPITTTRTTWDEREENGQDSFDSLTASQRQRRAHDDTLEWLIDYQVQIWDCLGSRT
jgi:hypothetical protein